MIDMGNFHQRDIFIDLPEEIFVGRILFVEYIIDSADNNIIRLLCMGRMQAQNHQKKCRA